MMKKYAGLWAFSGTFGLGKKKSNAFTLAETLITIGIIGVVTMMVMPTLITTTTIHKYDAQFKKSISTLCQAGLAGQSSFDLDYAATNTLCDVTDGASESPLRTLSFCSLFNGVMKGRYIGSLENMAYAINVPNNGKTASEGALTLNTNKNDYLAYELPEGTMVAFPKDARACTLDKQIMGQDWIRNHPQCIGFVDVNGIVTPNKIVNCDDYNPTVLMTDATCEVTPDMNHFTDIFPVVFHDSTVEPASPAGKAVLTKSKRTLSTDHDSQRREEGQ